MATGIKRDAIENYYGIATFAVETLTEHYSIGEIMDAVNNRELTGTFKALLSSFKNEGLEEVAANWGERIFNTLYEADKSELLQGIKDAQEEGKSTSQALIEMFKGAIGEDVESFIAGGFSGMLMGGVSIAGERMANNAGEIIDSSRIGDKLDTHSLSRSALDNDGGMRLIEAALELPEGSTARKVAEKYSNSDKKVSKHDAAVMMREVNRNLRKQISAQTESAAKQAIASELSERYGITDSDMTETAYRALTGQELSPDERALYEQSEQIREIVQDMQSDPNGKFARFFTETTTDAAISAAEQAMQTRETIAGVESGSTKALGSIVRPYIGKGNQKVVRGTKITAVNADGTFEMSTVDHKGADAGTVTISTSDLSSRVRGIYDAVIESTDNADIANAIIQAAATDRSVVAQISPELVTTVSDITRSGLSLSDGGIAMFAGVNTAAWERAGDTLKQAIYNATQKGSSDAGAVYSSVTREDVVRAYAASGKLGSKHAANAMLRLIERTAERYGVQTVFADLANGYKGGHIAGTNRIVLGMDIDAGLLTRTMGHEMFHYLTELNGALAGQLQSDVITWLKDTGKYDAVYAQFEENYSDETAHLSEAKKRTYLEEEIAADSCFDALSNDKFLASFCTETMKKKGGESFIKKLAEFFSSLSQMLRDTVANFRQRYKSNELVKALSEDADMLEHINEKFRELLESAKSAENKKNADTAQGDVRYSKNTDNKEILQIKKQIIASQDTLNAMNPVAHITSQGRNGRSNAKLQNDIAEKLKTKGYVVDVKGFGKIQIDEKRVKLALEYCTTDAEIAVFDTIHNVLKKNNVIGKHADHKNRSYETVTFAAPVVINGKRGNVGVVVRNTKGWLYKAHRILMPDGTAFNLDVSSKNEKSEMPTNGGNSKAEQRPFIISDSDNSISDSGQDVNTSDKENSGNVRYQMSAEKYSYDELVSKPDIKITTVEEKAIHKLYKTDRKAVINRALQNAKKVGGVNDHGAAFVHVNDINTDVIITSKSISHGLYRKYNTLGVVSENIGSILQNSIRINELKSRTDNIDSSYVLIGIATNEDGYPYIIRSIVNKYSNELSSVDVLYAINAKKESAALLAPRVTGNPLSITDSFISISDLLDFVNRYFPDILPESVLRHYGHTARPDGMLGGSALFQKSADSVREAEIRRLRQDYELTKLQNDLIRSKLKVWEHKVPSPKALRRYMNDVMQRYGVQYDDAGKLQAFEKLTEIYGYLVRSKAPNMVIVQDMAFDLARDMIANSAELEKTPYDSVEREFRRTLRETGVQITEAQKREIINAYGTMTNFRRESGGMIRINSKSKLFVADIIEEARSIYDIKTDHEDEFLVELLPYMKASADAAKGVWVDPYNGDAQIEHMAAMDLAATLLDALYDPNIVPGGYTYDKRRKKEFCRS